MAAPHTVAGRGDFPNTSWSAIRQLQERGAPEYRRHLERLVTIYWKPVFCVIRYAWGKSPDDAKDLTQEFFLRDVIEGPLITKATPGRGSFRSFLKGAIANFVRQAGRDAARQKRGGGQRVLSLDDVGVESSALVDGAQLSNPDDVFDTAWKTVVLTNAVSILESRLRAQAKEATFTVFKRYELDDEGAHLSYEEVGRPLGLSESQVKHALIHARSAFRDVITEIVREYVEDQEELGRELKGLFGI